MLNHCPEEDGTKYVGAVLDDCQGGGGGRRWMRVKKGIMVMEGDLTWGGEYTVHCTDEVL